MDEFAHGIYGLFSFDTGTADQHLLNFKLCKFKRDFGPWKRGDKAFTLQVDPLKGSITDDDKQTCEFDLRPASQMTDLAELVQEAGK